MSARQPSPHDNIARRWLALAERRMAHFVELRDSGRWRHYYAQPAQIHEAVREAIHARDEWAKLAGGAPAPSGAPV
jgi:uncharacterized repeat protein (TIGR03809 family)